MNQIEPVFVEEIPRDLQPGKLYVSVSYRTAAHLCPCGCDREVVNALHPARFSLTFDGETVSLHPSIGNSNLPCRSHYFITRNRIRWCRALSDQTVARARLRDQRAIEQWEHRSDRPETAPEPGERVSEGWRTRAGQRRRRAP